MPMTDEEVLQELRSDSLLNKVRREVGAGAARIEQACAQRKKPTAVEVRRMEFEVASKIIAIVVNGRR